ncbi:MAG: cyclase family protein [Bacteroidales bacterium]|nr:cyclase family protein [Bacteroidales bacterium]
MTIVDLTHTLYHEMPVFPGEKSPGLTRDPLPESAGYVTHRLETNMHTGTHMDAPMHAKSGELTIDSYPAEFFIRESVVLDVRGEAIIRMRKEWFSVFENIPLSCFAADTTRNGVMINTIMITLFLRMKLPWN